MILRRFAEHLRKQPWTAIGIEFVIVVVGVFVGLQVENWNEARAQVGRELEMLERLQEELEAVETDLALVTERFTTTERSTAWLLEALRSGQQPDDRELREALRNAQYVWDAPAASVTYSELVATGALSRLSRPELRTALTRYGDFAERYDRRLASAISVVLDPESRFLGATEWNTDPNAWTTDNAIVRYDWQALIAARSELQSWQAHQVDLRDYVRGQLDEVRLILSLLASG